MIMKQNQYSWQVDLTGLLQGGDNAVMKDKNIADKGKKKDTKTGRPRRRSSVSFAPLPPPFNRSTSLPSSPTHFNGSATLPSVSFAPLPPPLKRSTSMPSLKQMKEKRESDQSAAHLKSKGFRPDYSLGDTARSPSHMIIKPTSEQAFQAVNSLQKHDFAFIKRSDGSYSYAILAFRSLEPSNYKESSSCDSLEEYMAFVMDGSGSVKMLKKNQWIDSICLASTARFNHRYHPIGSRARKKHGRALKPKEGSKEKWSPPSIISFIPTSLSDDANDLAHLNHLHDSELSM